MSAWSWKDICIVLAVSAVFGLFSGVGRAAAADVFERDRCFQVMTAADRETYLVKMECP